MEGRHVMPSVMTSRQAAELDYSLERNGFTPEHVKKMSEGDFLSGIRGTLDGFLEMKPIRLSIDRSKKFDPVKLLGQGWKVSKEDERSLAISEVALIDLSFLEADYYREAFHWRSSQSLCLKKRSYLFDSKGKFLEIHLDAKVLEILLENQNLIPSAWKKMKGFHIFHFCGTILKGPDDFSYFLHLTLGHNQRWSVGTTRYDFMGDGYMVYKKQA